MLTPETALRKDRTQPIAANLQHRHFAEIARIIRACPIHDQKHIMAWHFAAELAQTNPKFDRDRFLAACE